MEKADFDSKESQIDILTESEIEHLKEIIIPEYYAGSFELLCMIKNFRIEC